MFLVASTTLACVAQKNSNMWAESEEVQCKPMSKCLLSGARMQSQKLIATEILFYSCTTWLVNVRELFLGGARMVWAQREAEANASRLTISAAAWRTTEPSAKGSPAACA